MSSILHKYICHCCLHLTLLTGTTLKSLVVNEMWWTNSIDHSFSESCAIYHVLTYCVCIITSSTAVHMYILAPISIVNVMHTHTLAIFSVVSCCGTVVSRAFRSLWHLTEYMEIHVCSIIANKEKKEKQTPPPQTDPHTQRHTQKKLDTGCAGLRTGMVG